MMKYMTIIVVICLSFLFTVYCLKNYDQYLLDNNSDIDYDQLMSDEETMDYIISRVKRKGGKGGGGGRGSGKGGGGKGGKYKGWRIHGSGGGGRFGGIFLGRRYRYTSCHQFGNNTNDTNYCDKFDHCQWLTKVYVCYIILPVPIIAVHFDDFDRRVLFVATIITSFLIVSTYVILIVINLIDNLLNTIEWSYMLLE
ncbi:hybrid signal transduction histidine kinase B-like [Oppia nitens]|uniref:hybrid signal transduction histidine kinase B-like n=1 Tax=Oppia nitens TaxID=1686743 RepID=UPI0023DABA12|nr:hybrid signal transduction histidine kinase B-like [Oppia nitens]